MMKEQIITILKNDIKVDNIFEITGKVYNSNQIRTIVYTELKDILSKDLYTKINDSSYFVPIKKDMFRIISDWRRKQYIEEKFDCDNFALAFKVFSALTTKYKEKAEICVGRISIEYVDVETTKKHALNLILYIENDKAVIRFFEPQTNNLYDLDEFKKMFDKVKIYFMEF